MPTYPAPPWLRERIPTALQVFGGELPFREAGESASLTIEQGKSQPILMSCPGCGGGLKITKEMERTVQCQYCSASVFLPDELWNRLHPVKLMARWTLTYHDELLTVEMLARLRQHKEAQRNWRGGFWIVLSMILGSAIIGVGMWVSAAWGPDLRDFRESLDFLPFDPAAAVFVVALVSVLGAGLGLALREDRKS